MSQLTDAIRIHLGREIEEQNLTLYSLLDVPQSASTEEIKKAWRIAASAWNASDRKSNPAQAQLVSNALKEIQIVLLDEKKRQQYDALLLKKMRESSKQKVAPDASVLPPSRTPSVVAVPASERELVPASDDSPLERTTGVDVVDWEDSLPPGDPTLPFDPAELAMEPDKDFIESPADRYRLLMEAIEPESRTNSIEQWIGSTPSSPSSTKTRSASKSTPAGSVSRLEEIKRRRRRKQLLTVSVLLIASLGFLGFAAVRFAMNRQELAKKDPVPSVAPTDLQSEFEAGMRDRKEQERSKSKEGTPSDLPSLPSVGDMNTQPNADAPSMSGMGGMESPASPFNATPAVPPAGMPDSMTPMSPTTPESMEPGATDSKTPVMPPGKPEMDADPSGMPNEPGMPETMPKPPSGVPESMNVLSMEDKNKPAVSVTADLPKWKSSMTSARESLIKADFIAFHASIEEALKFSSTAELEEKQARLDQLGQLYEIGINALRDSKSKLKGSQEISVGRLRISVVEVKQDELILRASGKNQRYAWSKLPMGIAIALMDLTLDSNDPTDIAARGVYLALSPDKTDLYEARIKDYFGRSLGKGQIRADLPQAITESYE